MAFTFAIVDEVVEAIALLITAISAYFMYRQRTTSYNDAKNLIVAILVLFGIVILSEFFGTFLANELALRIYLILGTCLILLSVQLLTMLAWSVYLVTRKPGLGNLLSSISKTRSHLFTFVAGTTYIAFVGVFLIVAGPYSFQPLPFPAFQFSPLFLGLLFGVLILFMGYTSTIFVSARRKTDLPNVKRALVLLPLIWIGIGVDLLVFNSVPTLPVAPSVDVSPFGYLIASIGLGATSTIFRRASLLAGFFETRQSEVANEIGYRISRESKLPLAPFTRRLGLKEDTFSGRKYLLEVDSSASYEDAVKDFANQLLDLDYSVFVFTSKGSSIYNVLRSGRSRFYLLSTSVSYTTVSSIPTEVLVPHSDAAVLLDAFQKTLETDPISPIGIVFDNVSDFVLSLGLATSYKFLKKILEVVDSDRITALFLMTAGAHEEKQINLLRSLFANQLMLGSEGLKIKRLA